MGRSPPRARPPRAARPRAAGPIGRSASPAAPASSARLALTAGLALALLAACADPAPIIREVDRLRSTDDPYGPYAIAARISPGDDPMTVRLRYALGPIDPLDAPCVDGPPPTPQRTADAGPADARDAAPRDPFDAEPPDAGPADAGPADAALDPPDAGPLEPVGAVCHLVPLSRRADTWSARFHPGPVPLGSRILYRLEALDGDGDRAVWPADGPAVFEVAPAAPLLAEQLAPRHGPATGGTEVLLRGDGFGPGLAVRFAGRPAAVRIESPRLATVTTPPGAPGPATVEVERDGQRVRIDAAFTYDAPPRIERVDPAEAPADTPLLLIVDGEGFDPGARVGLGDRAPEPASQVDPDRVVADLAPHPAGPVDVVVYNPDGQQARAVGALVLHPPPRLDAIAPDRGPDGGGTRVRLTGADIRRPITVWFGDRRAASASFVDAGAVDAITPLHPGGVVDVTLYNPDGQSATLPGGWRFVGLPRVDEVDPGVVGRCGGALATLRGAHFTDDMQVRIGGAPAEVLEVSEDGTEARVRLPRGDVGEARVEVTGADGRVFRADGLVRFDRRPVIRDVEPTRIPIWGQDDVVVRGADLDAVSAVTVGERRALGFAIVPGDDPCDGRLLVDTPAGDDGPADLRLDDARGEAARLPDGLVYVAPRLEPAVGLQPGYTNATLTGVGLVADLAMTIGGRAPRAVERISDERWRVVTPAGEPGPTALRFVLARANRSASVQGGFTYRVFRDRSARRLDPRGDCNDVSVADLDGDGRLDVAGAYGGMGAIEPTSQSPAVHLNTGDGFRRVPLDPPANGINARVGDVDGDGDLDLLYANLSGPQNQLFLNDGAGGFRLDPRFAGTDSSYDADFVDVDGDGDLDIFSLRIGSPQDNRQGPEQLWLNDGRGRFSDARDRLPHNPLDVHDHDFAHGDLDGDGLPDLVIVVDNLSEGFQTARNRLWMNTGGGRFAFRASPFNAVRGDWLDVKIVDLDGDGDNDVVMPQDYLEGFSFGGTPPVAIWLNDGRANFEAAHDRVRGLARLPAYEAVPVDLDGDGDLDLLIAVYGILYGDGTVEPFRSALLLNDGTATWFEATSAFVELPTIATANYGVGDFDGDGDLDLFECAARGQSRLWHQE